MQEIQAKGIFPVSNTKIFLLTVFTLESAHCSCLLVSLLTHFAQIKIYHTTIREIRRFCVEVKPDNEGFLNEDIPVKVPDRVQIR